MGMPVPDHSSPVNEPPSLLLPVDNSEGEVIKTEPLFSQIIQVYIRENAEKPVASCLSPKHQRLQQACS
jgi:hypothetical protein